MDIQIRRAERQDCNRILELIKELALYERAPDEVNIGSEQLAESGFGEQPVWRGFVAVAEEYIIGFALYYVRFSTWKGERMYLEDILVTESWRGKGVGSLLFNRLITEARERQFNAIVWQVLNWNEPAIRFYRKYQASFDDTWLNARLEITPLTEPA
jgi:GNAT superfamily N-acetyltransferase